MASDLYILIIGHRYGSITTGRGKKISYTEKEFDYAIKNKKNVPVLAFIRDRKVNIDTSLLDPENKKRLDDFIKKVQNSNIVVEQWTTGDNLAEKLVTAMNKIFRKFDKNPASTAGWVKRQDGRYPDVVTGHVTITASQAPVKLIANSSGSLRLSNPATMRRVIKDEIIAYIDNPTSPEEIQSIDNLLKSFNPTAKNFNISTSHFPKIFPLGELNPYYYKFLNALQLLTNYQKDGFYESKNKFLKNLLIDQNNMLRVANQRLLMAKNSLLYSSKFYTRDSVLFKRKVISEAEFDKTQMNNLAAKDSYQAALNIVLQTKQQIQQTKNGAEEIGIQNPEKNNELRINLQSAYNELVDNIKFWKQRYVFRAPFDGRIQFSKFYSENQFVQNGEQVFTIIPSSKKIYGQVILPAIGSGKVKKGQEVIVKLDNFPFMEFGSVIGKVESISMISNTEKTQNGNYEIYLATIQFPVGLKTNYGQNLEFQFDSKGTAEIVTSDRRLIERFFDNLKYAVSK